MLPEIPLETLIISFGYFGIFMLMIVNGLASFPSSQVLYVATGYFVFTGDLLLPAVIVAGAVGNTVGNIALYELTRRKGVAYAIKRNLIPERELHKLRIVFDQRGIWFIFIGKLIPGLKVFVPIAAAAALVHRGTFAVVMLITSALWTLPFIGLGYFFGHSAEVYGWYSIAPIGIGLVVVMILYRLMNSPAVLKELSAREAQGEATVHDREA
jgi:membrane protein DedA with SNARE-associated domain